MNQEGKKWTGTLRYWLEGLGSLILLSIATVVVFVVCCLIFLFAAVVPMMAQETGEAIPLLAWSIGFPVYIWLLTSPLICLYWLFRPAEWFWWKHKYISHAIGFGGFIGCVFIIAAGIHFLLWFFPDGKIAFQARFFIAGAIGIIATFALWDRLCQFLEEKRQKARESRISNRVNDNMSRLCDPFKADKTVAELRRRKAKLDDLWEKNRLSPFQEEEQTASERLWDKENLRIIIKTLTEQREKDKLDLFGKKTFIELIQKLKEQLKELEELGELEEIEELEEKLTQENNNKPKDD